MASTTLPRLLLIAGSDSSGGAGLEADQKVAAAHGCYALTATTALTAQNTQGVFGIHEIPSDFVKKQIKVCQEDIAIDVIKTGMLASAETVRVVAQTINHGSEKAIVVDPVMVSTSGSRLLPAEAVSCLIQQLLPITTLLTPNVPEAEILIQESSDSSLVKPKSLEGLIKLATQVKKLGPRNVLLKGGHLPLTKSENSWPLSQQKQVIYSVLVNEAEEAIVFESEYQESKNTHGTGCSLATAIACKLALGENLQSAVRNSLRYVEMGIKKGPNIGHGHGPLNHFHSLQLQRFTSGYFIDYLLERDDIKPHWQAYIHHSFVQGLGNGTLPLENFKSYLIQDYLFLIQFSRANSLASYKATDPEDIQRSAGIVLHIYREMSLHIDYCAGFGLSKADILSKEETLACTAYTRFVLDIGQTQDWLALQIAILPCLLGYGMIGMRLYKDPKTVRDGNKYLKWIENYAAEDFQEAVTVGRELIERHASQQSPKRIEELVKIFIKATDLETGFWDMGLRS